jgi:hypothetical protein
MGLFIVRGVFHEDSAVMVDRAYTGPLGNFSIMYPSSWSKTEAHEVSNKPVDNTEDVNTVTFAGDEGEVVIQWGSMGYGGGCPPQDYKDIRLKNRTVRACNGTSVDGTMYWSGISNGASDETTVEVRAKANIPTKMNMQTIEAMLRTLQLN